MDAEAPARARCYVPASIGRARRPHGWPGAPGSATGAAAGDFFFSATSTAPKINFATNPKTARSNIIWMLTRILATSVFAVMSPNPTVEKTVMVKYSESVLLSGWVKLFTSAFWIR